MPKSHNRSGKTLIIFLGVISILLLSLTVITLFFFQKENELRIKRETQMEQMTQKETSLQEDLKEAKKQAFLLEEKVKEADEKINSLLDDLELEQGLREELKNENLSLKEVLSNENQEKERIRGEADQKMASSKEEIVALVKKIDALTKHNQELQKQVVQLQQYLEQALLPPEPQEPAQSTIRLEKNIEKTVSVQEGKILSVDQVNKFVIVNLGKTHGVYEGAVLSVYQGGQNLGELQVTRTQEAMSAADILPPLSVIRIQKDDRVIIKK